MAQPIAINDTVEVRFYLTAGPQVAIVVRHYEVTGVTGTGGTDVQFATTLGGTFPTVWKNIIAAGARYEGVIVQIIKPTRRVDQIDTTGNGVGINNSSLLPPQTAGRIRLYTAQTGKSFRGRVYIPFPAEGQLSATGLPTGGYITDATNLKDALLNTRTAGTGANTSDLRPIVYSRKLNLRTTITSGQVAPFWGSMRRRSFINRGDRLPF